MLNFKNATIGIVFLSIHNIMKLRKIFSLLFIFISSIASAQKIESIHVNLYTDSLKKGTYNYINVDGRLSNGKYVPLDSTEIIFWASDGRFSVNSLWINKDFNKENILIKVTAKNDKSLSKEFMMYIKKKPDDEKLKTNEELIKGTGENTKKKKNN